MSLPCACSFLLFCFWRQYLLASRMRSPCTWFPRPLHYTNHPPARLAILTQTQVPHTHDDAGWLKTVEQYYLGQDPLSSCDTRHFLLLIFTLSNILIIFLPDSQFLLTRRYGDRIEVRKIITSVINALSMDSNRKFVYVEQVFFQMWWNDQSESVRNVVRQLVKGEFPFPTTRGAVSQRTNCFT